MRLTADLWEDFAAIQALRGRRGAAVQMSTRRVTGTTGNDARRLGGVRNRDLVREKSTG